MLKLSALVTTFITISSLALHHTSQAQQVYKYKDANGKTVYSSTPPPPNAKRLETKVETSGSETNTSNVPLPFELNEAVKKNPVTFYCTTNASICNTTRNFLKTQGIPFSEKIITTQDDIKKLKQLTGDTQLPAMAIGSKKISGYNSEDWSESLKKAGYPDKNMLPNNYRYPDPTPLSPVATENSEKKEVKAVDTLVPRTSSPSGIRF